MLKQLKLMLGLATDDTELDAKLKLILSLVQARLQLLLGGIEPPESMEHIIIEVAIVRFNRIGSEGMKSHTVEGESLAFGDNDFAEFKEEIQAFLDSQSPQEDTKQAKVRFL